MCGSAGGGAAGSETPGGTHAPCALLWHADQAWCAFSCSQTGGGGREQTRSLALPEVLAAERDGKLDQLAANSAMDVFSLGLLLHKVWSRAVSAFVCGKRAGARGRSLHVRIAKCDCGGAQALLGRDVFEDKSQEEIREELLSEKELELDTRGLKEHIGR